MVPYLGRGFARTRAAEMVFGCALGPDWSSGCYCPLPVDGSGGGTAAWSAGQAAPGANRIILRSLAHFALSPFGGDGGDVRPIGVHERIAGNKACQEKRACMELTWPPGRGQSAPMTASVDPITRSVVQHRLSGIVAEMGEAMLRTSYS